MILDTFSSSEGTTSRIRLTTGCKRDIVHSVCLNRKRPSVASIAGTRSSGAATGRSSAIPVAGGTIGPRDIREWVSRVMGKGLKRRSHSILDSHIPTFWFGSSNVCTYCGDNAQGVDHVIPWSFQKDRPRHHQHASGPMTYACTLCNSFLSNRFFSDFRMRCEFVRDYLDRKARPVIWHNYELEKLDYTVRTYIQKQQKRRLWLRMRADWFEGRDFLLNLEPLLWERHLDRFSGTFHKGLHDYFWSTLNMLKHL